ncbi:MAG: 50S ribosomal protein L9 [bacterium]|nr:50S ribosomal protein L9 [bacterium]
MKIILLQDVKGIGRKFDIKNVADGYAINFLLPRKLAEPGTGSALERAEKRRKEEEVKAKVHADLLLKNVGALKGTTIEMSGKGNEKGHLFAAIHKEAIAEALKKQTGIDVLPDFIHLEKPVKEAGEHTIGVETGGKKGTFTLLVKIVGE